MEKFDTRNEKIVVVTERAATRLCALLAEESARGGAPVVAMRLSLKKGGCAGTSFALDYVREGQEEKNDLRQQVQAAMNIALHIDPAATMFLLGTQIDHQETKLSSGFVFNSPMATARCGCGESVAF